MLSTLQSNQFHAHSIGANDPERTVFIIRGQSYHGASVWALNVSGYTARREPYESILPKNSRFISPCYRYRDLDGRTEEQYVLDFADELDKEIPAAGPKKVAGLILEPVVGAVSVSMPVSLRFHT
jgi:adenosylmethionine-8-amino-7-oxononanoate aminotransferase